MSELHTDNINTERLVSSEVHSADLVCSNTSLISDCTSLGASENEINEDTENLLLDELADLLVETYLENKSYGQKTTT